MLFPGCRRIDGLLGNPECFDNIAVHEDYPARCQRAHRKFFLPGHSELSYDEDVKRCMQCIRYLVSDRNTSPWQGEDDHVISVPKLAEFRSEQKAGFKAIRQQHGPSSYAACSAFLL